MWTSGGISVGCLNQDTQLFENLATPRSHVVTKRFPQGRVHCFVLFAYVVLLLFVRPTMNSKHCEPRGPVEREISLSNTRLD